MALSCAWKSMRFQTLYFGCRYPKRFRVYPDALNSFRFCTSGTVETKNVNKPKSLVRRPGKIRQAIFSKFMNFVHGYENILRNRFPRTFRVYRVFIVGSQQFYHDALEYARISRDLRQGRRLLKDLQRKEIELYYLMPKELWRVAPVLLLSALPFTNYFIFPIAYWFPRYLLSSHFWSLQQKVDFALLAHKKRLYHYRPVFRHLQAKWAAIKDAELRDKCGHMLHKLGSGVHPDVPEILETERLFSSEPYELNILTGNHVSVLCRMHGLSTIGPRRRRLWVHAGMIREMDLALRREGHKNMTVDEMRKACFLRGLNPVGMKQEDMEQYLQQWTEVTHGLGYSNLSLLLHCPILLAYNQPTNWSLIH